MDVLVNEIRDFTMYLSYTNFSFPRRRRTFPHIIENACNVMQVVDIRHKTWLLQLV